jgi:hypothetical protein
MTVELKITETRLVARLDKMVPDVHDALKRGLGPLAASMAADAREIAANHIRFQGKKPGLYLASIYGGVSDKNGAVTGYVRTSNPLAHFLDRDDPFTIGPHDILPSSADALAFLWNGAQVYAKVVHSPGAVVPPYPAIKPAFKNAESQVREVISQALGEAVSK